jgi:hypothetical protein
LAAFDRAGIAERLRGLLAGQDAGDLARTAARLGVEEISLRMSLDQISPHPTVEVLASVIRVYGIDPAWLLTGRYDPQSHRAAMEGQSMATLLRDFLALRNSPISDLPPEHFRVNEQN